MIIKKQMYVHQINCVIQEEGLKLQQRAFETAIFVSNARCNRSDQAVGLNPKLE